MRLVVADTSPLVYSLLIERIGILPQLLGSIVVPEAVFAELNNPRAPAVVRAWAATLPKWVEVKKSSLRLFSGSGTPIFAIDRK